MAAGRVSVLIMCAGCNNCANLCKNQLIADGDLSVLNFSGMLTNNTGRTLIYRIHDGKPGRSKSDSCGRFLQSTSHAFFVADPLQPSTQLIGCRY